MTDAELKQFEKERDEAFLSYDVQKFKEFWAKWYIKGVYELPLPASDYVIEVLMRKGVYNMKGTTIKQRLEAKRWLEERGFSANVWKGIR